MKFSLSRHFIAALTATSTVAALNGAHAASNEMEQPKQDLQRHLRAAGAGKPATSTYSVTSIRSLINETDAGKNKTKPTKPDLNVTKPNTNKPPNGLKCTTRTNSTGVRCCINPVGAYVSALAVASSSITTNTTNTTNTTTIIDTNSTNSTKDEKPVRSPRQGWIVNTGNGGCAEVCIPDCADVANGHGYGHGQGRRSLIFKSVYLNNDTSPTNGTCITAKPNTNNTQALWATSGECGSEVPSAMPSLAPTVSSAPSVSNNCTSNSNSTSNSTDNNCTTDRNSTGNQTTDTNRTRLLSVSGLESSDSIYPKVRNLLSWIFGIPEGAQEELIDVEEVEGSEIEHAVQDWTFERKCDVPELEQSDNPAAWNYYDGLIEKNRNIASLARSVKEYAPKRGLVEDMIIDAELQEDDEDDEEVTNKDETQSFIPRRLLFTHKEDLLNCDVSSSEPSLHTMAHNVHDTIKAYSEVWGDDMEYDFLTDVECRKAIYETEPELLAYYDDLEGMFKGDICRSAYLYLNGGYYLDVDLLVVHPFVASPVNKFVTVKWAWYDKDKQFFQAFIAAAPRNEIIKKSLSIMLELLNGTRAKRGGGEMHMIGTQAMQDAWAELAQDDASVASHGKDEEVYLLSEHRIGEYQGSSSYGYFKLPTQTNGGDAGYTDITCNFVVADDEEESVYFFSHILGAEFCGKQL